MIGIAKRFVSELRRRHVFRVAAMYAVVAWVLMQIGEVVFPALRLPEWTLTLLVVLLILGFPLALALAWAFDVTPKGVVRTDVAEGLPPATEGPPPTDRPSPADADGIVVLPFQNMSADAENEYFSDGITEDLIHRLYQAGDLRVISRSSAWQYKNPVAGARQIGADLGVAYLVEGSVRRSGETVRVVAQLIDARDDRHLWSESYDRELSDIFAIQSEVAGCIADALHVTLKGDKAAACGDAGTTDIVAYDRYLKGRYLWNRRGARDLEEAVRQFEAAIERDGQCTAAHAGLAEAWVTLAIYGVRPPEEVMPLARAAAEKALARNPADASALSALACIHAVYDWEWAAAENEFRRVIDAVPQYSTAPQWFATNLLIPLGRFDEAEAQLDRAAEADPVSPTIEASRGVVEFMRGNYDAARSRFRRLTERDERLAFAHYYAGLSALHAGDPEAALAALQTAVAAGGASTEIEAAHACALAACDREAEARVALARMIAAPGRYASPVRIAQVHLALGEHDAALERLEAAVPERSTDLIWLGVFPAFAALRGDPRYAAVHHHVFGREAKHG